MLNNCLISCRLCSGHIKFRAVSSLKAHQSLILLQSRKIKSPFWIASRQYKTFEEIEDTHDITPAVIGMSSDFQSLNEHCSFQLNVQFRSSPPQVK